MRQKTQQYSPRQYRRPNKTQQQPPQSRLSPPLPPLPSRTQPLKLLQLRPSPPLPQKHLQLKPSPPLQQKLQQLRPSPSPPLKPPQRRPSPPPPQKLRQLKPSLPPSQKPLPRVQHHITQILSTSPLLLLQLRRLLPTATVSLLFLLNPLPPDCYLLKNASLSFWLWSHGLNSTELRIPQIQEN